jgi:hypothetical protein
LRRAFRKPARRGLDPQTVTKTTTPSAKLRNAAVQSGFCLRVASVIYPYVLTRDERNLNIRAFSDNMKREAYERQKGICPVCKKKFELGQMEGDHIKPWHEGGKTNAANCQMLCKMDNRTKSGK